MPKLILLVLILVGGAFGFQDLQASPQAQDAGNPPLTFTVKDAAGNKSILTINVDATGWSGSATWKRGDNVKNMKMQVTAFENGTIYFRLGNFILCQMDAQTGSGTMLDQATGKQYTLTLN